MYALQSGILCDMLCFNVFTLTPEPEAKKIPIWKKIGMWICGIEKTDQPEMTEEERQALEEKQTSLDEDPFWKKVVSINAIVLMVVAVFFWAFFY